MNNRKKKEKIYNNKYLKTHDSLYDFVVTYNHKKRKQRKYL